ncbi:Endonuclease NucS [uncultured archaeon]|nr:Endonuclease NucS [uncultured archaeon]
MVLKEAVLKDEAELEALLIKNPAQIEEGFSIITHQKTHKSSRLDILGLDSNKTLTLLELKVVSDVGQLRQALSYYTWILDKSSLLLV